MFFDNYSENNFTDNPIDFALGQNNGEQNLKAACIDCYKKLLIDRGLTKKKSQ